MRSTVIISCGFLTLFFFFASCSNAQSKGSDVVAGLPGDWSGESTCADKQRFPGCKDEVVVYHVTPKEGKSDTVHISMDKIVNGETLFMAEDDFVYNAKKKVLTSEYKNDRVHLVIELALKDDVLEGTVISLPDKSTVRHIKIKKDQKKSQ